MYMCSQCKKEHKGSQHVVKQFKNEVKKIKNEVMNMIQGNGIITHKFVGNHNTDEQLIEYDAQLAHEIQNIEMHFNNIVQILGMKKEKMIKELRASLINGGNQGILNFQNFKFKLLLNLINFHSKFLNN